MKTVKEIVKDYLIQNNYTGLMSEDIECGCQLDDLVPCDGPIEKCIPGYKANCDCEDHYGWHIQKNKP